MSIVSSMKDIDKISKNGYKVISSFSGCGGSSLGLTLGGFKVLAAIEFIPEAVRTYKANFKDTYVYDIDIRDISGKDILSRFNLNRGELDVFEGSPPCSDFSTQRRSSSTEKGKFKVYSETKQRVDDLFFEYARLLKELCPKVFIAENTSSLVNQKDYFNKFLSALENSNEIGYKVYHKVINFSDLEVPQSRKRVIFVGVRKDIPTKFYFPENCASITTEEAIGDLIDMAPDMEMTDLEKKYCRLIPVGATSAYIIELRKKYGLKVMIFNHRRDTWNIPHPTLVHNTRHIHPLRNRWLTVLEGKRLSTFPDDFILTGNTNQQWERIGRAVPPLVYYKISKQIEKVLDDNRKG